KKEVRNSMALADWIAGISAGISLIGVAGSCYFANKARQSSIAANNEASRANEIAREQNVIAMGVAETTMRDSIARASAAFQDVSMKIIDIFHGRTNLCDLDTQEQAYIGAYQKVLGSAVEVMINSYEEACAKYIDGKLDKDRFKKMYFLEIKRLCDENNLEFKKKMHPADTSPYQAIWKVYREWYHFEK
ncbi:MAG: hypothetical protein ABFD66_09325, partial [Smithella sp.]